MSFKAVDAVRDATVPLTSTEVLVLLVLATYADEHGGSCWPAQSTIASKTRLSERYVREVLKRLASASLLTVVESPTGTRSARYQIHLKKLARPDASSALSTATAELSSGLAEQEMSVQGGTMTAPDRNHATPREERGSPDSLEPSLKRQDQPASPVLAPKSPGVFPFRVHAAIALASLDEATRSRDMSFATVAEIFKTKCAQQGKPCDKEVETRAIEAAFHSRKKAQYAMLAACKRIRR